ncbi:MAG: hypothetical protein PHE68_06230 [Candidatus Peribacteraceae bacterium]|nr:hypothetical protein [Candidatus Peribacteraceae bacterium]
MKKVVQLAAVLILTGCVALAPEEPIIPIGWTKVGTSELGLAVPPLIQEKIHRPDDSWAYITYDKSTTKRQSNDFSIEVFSPAAIDKCDDLGVSKPIINEKRNNDVLVWGEVDFRFSKWPDDPDMRIPEERNGVPCYPVKPATAAYVLCSEKNSKRVLICISQVTDNPELAEQIFNTFRWTE